MGFQDLGWEGWLVIAATVVALAVMAGDWVGPDIVFPMLLAFLIGSRCVRTSRGAQGYGNTGLLTVMSLYAVAEGIYQTGVLESAMLFVLGRSRSAFWANVRMMIPVMFVSAFLNNTPVVSLMCPILISWARRTGVPPKKVLIPLTYAAVLGGTCTLIGTSTNLVVSGMQEQRYTRAQQLENAMFRIFDIAPYGIPYAIWGFMFILATQSFLLPSDESKFETNLLFCMRVNYGSPSRGKTLLQSGLLALHGIRITAIVRKNRIYRDVAMDWVLEEHDMLLMAGELSQAEFVSEEHGLTLMDHEKEKFSQAHDDLPVGLANDTHVAKVVQVTLKETSPFVGSYIRDCPFGEQLDASVMAIKRGSRRDCLLGSVLLVAGDILVLDVGVNFDPLSEAFMQSFTDLQHVKDAGAKEFIISMRVLTPGKYAAKMDITGSEIVGKTVTEVGLRGIPGVSVIQVDRATGEKVLHVDHHVKIEAEDTVWFAADLAGVQFLAKFPGLQFTAQEQAMKTKVSILYRTYIQAAVAPRSHLVGRCVVDMKFRDKYGAALIGIHREEHRLPLDVRTTLLQSGDVLLLEAKSEWVEEHINDKGFVLLTPVARSSPPKKSRGLMSVSLGIIMVLTQVIPGIRNDPEWINLWPASMLTAGLMLATGCLSGNQYRWSFLWDIYLTIGAAFGVSAALEDTGVAKEIANIFIGLGKSVGTEGAALTGIYVATAVMSELLTNNAAGAVMYPIAAIAGEELGISAKAMSVAIMLGASAGFINPFSYQCNLMVFIAGNYRTREFAKIGAPFQVFLAIVASFILHFVDNWQMVWAVSFSVVGVFLAVPLFWAVLPIRYTLPAEAWVCKQCSQFASACGRLFCRRSASSAGDTSMDDMHSGGSGLPRSRLAKVEMEMLAGEEEEAGAVDPKGIKFSAGHHQSALKAAAEARAAAAQQRAQQASGSNSANPLYDPLTG